MMWLTSQYQSVGEDQRESLDEASNTDQVLLEKEELPQLPPKPPFYQCSPRTVRIHGLIFVLYASLLLAVVTRKQHGLQGPGIIHCKSPHHSFINLEVPYFCIDG